MPLLPGCSPTGTMRARSRRKPNCFRSRPVVPRPRRRWRGPIVKLRGSAAMLEQTRFLLPEEAIPTSWYNLAADLPKPPPPVLHPGTHQPIGPDDLAPLFPMAVIGQEVSTESFI